MGFYRKRPVVVQAFQMTLERRWDNSEWPNWLNRAWQTEPGEGGIWIDPDAPIAEGHESAAELLCGTLEGVHRIVWDDWIVLGIKGELYPCKPDIFEATYEEVDPPCSVDEAAGDTGWPSGRTHAERYAQCLRDDIEGLKAEVKRLHDESLDWKYEAERLENEKEIGTKDF